MNLLEKLIDANIDILEKTLETSKRGKTLKAEFVRDDGAGGKYYGYLRGGKVHVIHSGQNTARGRFGGTAAFKGQLGASEEGAMDAAPDASANSAVDFGGGKVGQWREDAKKILGGETGSTEAEGAGSGMGDREPGAVEAAGGGGAVSSAPAPEGVSMGSVTKPQTALENIVARLAEAEAQYLRVKAGKSWSDAYRYAITRAKKSFEGSVLGKIREITGHDIVYDVKINQFRYAKPVNGTTQLSPHDRSVVDKIVTAYVTEANKIIKAKTTAVRRAKGSDE